MITSIIVFVICYILIASEKVDKSIVALLGAATVIILHQVPYEKALEMVDLNVVFLLMGMMMIVTILSRTGLFEWVAVSLARKANGNAIVITMILLLVTAVFSAFLDNVTTIILIAPVTILLTQILEIPTVPILIMEAVFSNIGGTATLVGDPPNILIGSKTDLTFNEFLLNLGPVVLVIMAVGIVITYFTLRRSTVATSAARKRIEKAQPNLAIIEPRVLKRALPIFGLVIVGFFAGHAIGVEPGIVALAGGVGMTLVGSSSLHDVMQKVEWGTILFFIGLFMLVGALEYNGVFDKLGHFMLQLTQDDLFLTAILILWTSAIISALVDNIPLVIAMIPLVQSTIPKFAESMGIVGSPELIDMQIQAPLFWALALGACLGGNGSLIGASANVVVSQVAKRNYYDLTFWRFTKYGFPIMAVSLIISSFYLYFRYFM